MKRDVDPSPGAISDVSLNKGGAMGVAPESFQGRVANKGGASKVLQTHMSLEILQSATLVFRHRVYLLRVV